MDLNGLYGMLLLNVIVCWDTYDNYRFRANRANGAIMGYRHDTNRIKLDINCHSYTQSD